MHRTAAILLAVLALAGCGAKKKDVGAGVQTVVVQRQDIVVDVEATGVITPIDPVQVKSKASGTVLKIYVETGSRVRKGDLLVKIDPRDPQNRYDQAAAAVEAAKASGQVTHTQFLRDSLLLQQGMITAPEFETAQLAYANARSQLVASRTNLDLASIALEDVTIRAPISGIVIEKDVSEGQVIASATGTVSGGTTLLQMANLGEVMDSTLVGESDIGNVKAGLSATVKVDAYPNRVFHGVVEKIAPQATVQQSVTMFPVFIRLDNRDGALMPGMNSDVAILVEQRDNVLAVPNDAVRGTKDVAAAARALGLDPATVRATLAGGTAGNGAPPSVSVSRSQCDSVQAVIAKHPEAQHRLQALLQQMQSGGDRAAIFPRMTVVYDSLHLDAGVARACAQLRRTSAGGTALADETPALGNTRPRPGLVFVAANGTFTPKVLTLGIGNYDVTQVLAGLQEGDRVALINAAMLQQARSEQQARIQSRVGLPGVSQQQTGGATKTAAPAAAPATSTTKTPATGGARPPGTP